MQNSEDQGYIMASRQEEMSHYLREQSLPEHFTPFSSFSYPFQMFSDAQTTLKTLVTLEDAFTNIDQAVQALLPFVAAKGGRA